MDSLDILSAWRIFMLADLAPATAEGYWNAAVRFFAANPIPIAMVTEAIVAGWIESFPYRSSRRVTYFHALRNLFRYCLRHGYIETDPTFHLHVASPEEKEPRSLSLAEYEAVKAAAYGHSPIRGYAVELLYNSGGRIGETCALRWENVTPAGIIFTHTKSGKERLVTWNQSLTDAVTGLREHFGECDRVLPRSTQTVWGWISEAGKVVGIRAYPHLLRATAATRAQQNGAQATAVQKFLGHSKLTTTSRYSAVRLEDIQKVSSALEV